MKNIKSVTVLCFILISSCSHFKGPSPASVVEERLSIAACEFGDLSSLSVKQPQAWGKEGMTGRSAASGLIHKLMGHINSRNCEGVKQIVQSHLATQVPASWDDFVILNILKNQLSEVMSAKIKLLALGFVSDMNAGIRAGDHDKHTSSKFNQYSANQMLTESLTLDFRNVIIQLSLEEFRARRIDNGYEGISGLTVEERSELAESISNKFAELSKTVDVALPMRLQDLSNKSHEFVEYCEKKLTHIFGNEEYSAAVATGWDRTVDAKRKLLGKYIVPDRVPIRRFHMFSNMHVYRNLQSLDSREYLYLPPTCTTSGRGTGLGIRNLSDGRVEHKESYPSSCTRLGRFGRVSIMGAHVANQGHNVPRIKNSAGSISVGILGGAGGSGGLAPGEVNNGYAHSHIQLTGGGFRLSFSDALCRTE